MIWYSCIEKTVRTRSTGQLYILDVIQLITVHDKYYYNTKKEKNNKSSTIIRCTAYQVLYIVVRILRTEMIGTAV